MPVPSALSTRYWASPAAARATVVAYLDESGVQARLLDVAVVGDRVTVSVAASAHLPLLGSVTTSFEGTTVIARASARSPIA